MVTQFWISEFLKTSPITLMMAAESSSKTSVSIYQTTEDSHLKFMVTF
jgi:hypothetical protein